MSIKFQSQGQSFAVQLSNVTQRHFDSELTMTALMAAEGFSYCIPTNVSLMAISANKLTIRNIVVHDTSTVAQLERKLPPKLQGKGFALHISIFKEIVSRLPADCFTVVNGYISINDFATLDALITDAFNHAIENYDRVSVFHHSGYVYSISSLQTSIFATREWEAGEGEVISRAPTKLILTQHELDISYSDDKRAYAYSTVIRFGGYELDLLPVFASQERTYALFIALLEVLNRAPSFQAAVDELIKAILSSANHKE